MQDCYEILNIPANSDVKQIKKAYAKLVKIHNPEDDPEGYQKLRNAYDKALKNAKRFAKYYDKPADNIEGSNKYLNLREKAYRLLKSGHMEEAIDCMINVYEIYNGG